MQERPKIMKTAPGRTARLGWLVSHSEVAARRKEAQNAVSQQSRRFRGTSSVEAQAIGEGEGRQGREWWTILDLNQ